jgi:3-oxoacyl-[acyl-carrier-protein] synthase-3
MVIDATVNVKILGVGRALPPGPAVSNVDLLSLDPALKEKGARYLERLSARIESKFGVLERYLAHQPWKAARAGEDTSEDLAFRAMELAIGQTAHPAPSLLIHGTTTTSRYTGSQAAAILGRLGIVAPAYDVKAGCSTSVASLHMAEAFLLAGYPDVAIACAETLSKVMHPENRETWFGLSDGGAAIWMERSETAPDFAITKSYFSTDGRHVDLYTTRGILPPTVEDVQSNGYALQGDKDQLSAVSRAHYAEMLETLFTAPFPLSQIDWVIPHQVNRDLIRDVLQAHAVHAQVVWDAREYGNLGGTSVLFSLAHAIERQLFKRHERILLMSVGGGLSSAAQVWEKL